MKNIDWDAWYEERRKSDEKFNDGLRESRRKSDDEFYERRRRDNEEFYEQSRRNDDWFAWFLIITFLIVPIASAIGALLAR